MNVMKQIQLDKITLNMGSGSDSNRSEKAVKLLQAISESKPVKTITQKRIPTWGVRPGLRVGCKVTLRGKKAEDLLNRLFKSIENKINIKKFDNQGNLSFGIREYIDIPDVKYDVDIGIIGLEVAITLKRPGFRIKDRKIQTKKIPARHRISKEEAIEFIKQKFGVKITEGDQI